MVADPARRPIRLVVADDLGRSRLTVFFRLVLAIPVLVWVTLWGIAAFVVGFVNRLAVLIEGRVPRDPPRLRGRLRRYATQVSAYVFLAANPYPWFRGQDGYPVDLEIDPPERQSRWTGLFACCSPCPRSSSRRSSAEASRRARAAHRARLRGTSTQPGRACRRPGSPPWRPSSPFSSSPAGVRRVAARLVAYAVGYAAPGSASCS